MPDFIQTYIRAWRSPCGEFALDLYDTGRIGADGKCRLAYRFWHDNDLIFSGDEFFPSPLHAIDSDATVAALLTFLSLRPGDTDADYFEEYTAAQLEFAELHGELLSLYAYELEDNDG